MPPTDKALAVMTPVERWVRAREHLKLISDFEEAVAAKARHFGGVPVEIAERAFIHVQATRAALDAYIEKLGVAHPERLAGEDEVVVKRAEWDDLQRQLTNFRRRQTIYPSTGQLYFHITPPPPPPSKQPPIDEPLAGSPTAQESNRK